MFSFLRSLFGFKSKVSPEPVNLYNHLEQNAEHVQQQQLSADKEISRVKADFIREIREIRKTVAGRFAFPFTKAARIKQESLQQIDKIANAYASQSGGFSYASSLKARDILSQMHNSEGYNTSRSNSPYKSIESLLNNCDKSLQSHREKRKQEQKEKSSQGKSLGRDSAFIKESISEKKLTNLTDQLAKQDYWVLVSRNKKTGGKILEGKLNEQQFDILKMALKNLVDNKRSAILGKINGEDRHYKVSSDDLTLGELPFSIILSEQDGKLQMTFLTQDKAQDGGGKSHVNRCFSATVSGNGIKIGTVMHKTQSEGSSLTQEEWRREALNDKEDQAVILENGALVKDGGDALCSTSGNVNPNIKGNVPTLVQNLMAEAAKLNAVHGDIKFNNVLLNNEGQVRIIDFPMDMSERLAEIKNNRIQGKANSLQELAGAMVNPANLSLVEGNSALCFKALGGVVMDLGVGKQLEDPAFLPIDDQDNLSPEVTHMVNVADALYQSFYVNNVVNENQPLPLYNDSWALLNTLEEVYETQGMTDDADFSVVQMLKKELLADFSEHAQQIKNVEKLQSLNAEADGARNSLATICDILNDDSLKDFTQKADKLKNARVFSVEGVDNEQEFTTKLQDFMQQLVDKIDEKTNEIKQITDGEEFKALAEGMNDKWSPKALAEKMGVEVSYTQEVDSQVEQEIQHEKEPEQVKEEEISKINELAKKIIQERDGSPDNVADFPDAEHDEKNSKRTQATSKKNLRNIAQKSGIHADQIKSSEAKKSKEVISH